MTLKVLEPEHKQQSIKESITNIKNLLSEPLAYAGDDMDVFSDMVYHEVRELEKAFEELAESVQSAYTMNESLITDKRLAYTDGTPIERTDVADLNMTEWGFIADTIGIELE